MGKKTYTLGTKISLVLVCLAAFCPVVAQENHDRQSAKKQLAMVLPKSTLEASPANAIAKAAKTTVQVQSVSFTPQEEFGSRPPVYTPPKSTQIPENVRLVLIDSASKAEQLSRSYNRRIADVIIWLANSMNNQSTEISPISSPNLHRQHQGELPPAKNNAFAPID